MECLNINYYIIYILLFLFPLLYYVVLRQSDSVKIIDHIGEVIGENNARILFFLVFIFLWISPYIYFEFCDLEKINKVQGNFFW
ncbi:MAG: hypothetical protein CMB81_01075 [Flammeovirgaceae bacterium]|nr:hypothetical protein [Flammeovirgaceae bacterium]